MLEKFSVRNPFTVLVGVILVIVLGVVSVMNTSTDLLPAMDLPVTAVLTTYIGATPEQVEASVTIPIETRMSTLSGIDTVQSISAEHMSIVILMFSETVSMDAAALEIREALDMMTFPDGASRPMTIRMNPEMMPIMMANVHLEGVSIDELSEFARNDVAPALEGVPGVAVVALSGLVQNQLHVVIENERIELVNQSMAEAAEALLANPIALLRALAALPEEAREAMGLGDGVGGMGGIGDMGDMEIALPAEMFTVDTVMGMLFAQDFSMPAGMLTDEGYSYMVRVGDRFQNVDEIKNMLIFDPGMMGLGGIIDIPPVRLSDIADVFVADDSHLSFTRVNGNPSVMLSIQRQSEFTTPDVSSAVRDRMDALSREHPGLGFAVLMDQGEMVDMVVGSVLDSLLWGGLLAIFVLLLFLRDIRPTLIVAVSIPVSLMLAFTLMYFTGVSLNMVSMGGLALTVGMLVDNSIAVIENIYRMRTSTSRSAARAAVSGARQMSGAIFAATVTTVAMFVPIIFTGGITRQIFMDFGLTIAFALLASLIIALTIVPAASSIILKNVKKEQEGRLFTRFVDGYEKALRFTLRFKWPVLLFTVGAFVLSFWAINRQGTELFPAMDMPQITVTAEMPEGATFEEATIAAAALSERILAIPDVETVGISVGGGGMMGLMAAGLGMGGFGGMGGEPSTAISANIILVEGRTISSAELSAQIREISEDLGLEAEVIGADGGMDMLVGAAVSIRVEGRELDDIRDTAIALAELVRSVEGTMNVTDLIEAGAPELRVTVDKDAAMANGLTVAQVLMEVSGLLASPERSMSMTLNGRTYEIIISDGNHTPPGIADIENLQIQTAAGLVALSEIADIREDIGFTAIGRFNRSRFVTVSGEITEGFNVGLVNDEIERRLETFAPAGDSRVVIGGQAEMIADAFTDLILMLALGLLFTYLIMVAQFQSLLSPFIIMLIIPLAFTGGFTGLLIAGMPLSIVSMIGLILLTGVAINNGIVLVSRVNQMRWEGMPKHDAIIDAGRKRIRPILMTAVSTIFAMSVLAIGIGEGTEMMQPMAIATIGGLLYATAMTLFVVPIMYDMLHKNKDITKEDLDSDD